MLVLTEENGYIFQINIYQKKLCMALSTKSQL